MALKLEARFREFEGKQKVIQLDHAFSAFSGDIIGRISLDKNNYTEEFLDNPDFAPDWYAEDSRPSS